MIDLIVIDNPFTMERTETKAEYTGCPLTTYLDLDWGVYDIYKNGQQLYAPDRCYPLDGEQYVIAPHVGGGGFKKVFGMVLTIGLMIAAPHITFGLSSMFARSLVSGAIMILGGRLINSMLHLNQVPQVEVNQSQSYGWELPTVQTQEGNTIGETYGSCIPAPQLLMCHVDTVDDNTQYLNVLYCGGYGPVDSITDLRIGYTPIENFQDCQVETRTGTNDQAPISFFPDTVADQSVDMTLKEGNAVIRSTDSNQVNKIEVTVTFPSGIYYQNDDGNFADQTARFNIAYRVTGTNNWSSHDYSITRATNQAVRKTYTFSGLASNRYDVRVTAVETPLTNRRCALMQWSILSAYIYTGAFIRPNKVLVAMRVKATSQLNGGVPNLTWTQTRRNVWVYDQTAKTYVQKAADNPIWAAYDILHQCRRLKNVNTGAYEFVVEGTPKERFTAYWQEWVDAAAYADEMVTTNDGTKEKRLQFDAIFDTSMKRLEAANKAANVGHAVIIQHGTQFGIAVDKPGVMRQIFGEGRTLMSSFNGSFSSLDDRARSVEITYNDKDNDYKNTEFFIRSARYAQDVELQDNTAQLTLFGVSRRSQAYREGMYLLATNERQLETVTFSADINAIVCEYGDIIGVSHSVARIGLASGRIVAVDGNTITLDKDVTLDASESYGVKIQLSANDHIISRDIKAVAGTSNKVTVTTTFDADNTPAVYDTYALGVVDKIVQPFRITKVEKDSDEKVSLTCVQYDEAIYDVDYSRYPVIDYTAQDPLRAPVNLTLVEQAQRNYAGVKIDNIVASWQMPGNSRYESFRVYYSVDGVSWTSCGSTTDMQITIGNVDPTRKYHVRVSAVLDGVESAYVLTTISLTGNIQPAVEPENIVAYTRFRKLLDGTDRYDIAVSWGPDGLNGRVYYKPNHVQADRLVFQDGVAADELGWCGPWTYAGSGVNQFTIPQCVPGDTYRIAICTANELGEYTTPDNSPHKDVLCAARTTTPNTPGKVSILFHEDHCTVSWGAVTNTDIAFYEVRTDTGAGTKDGAFLLRTNSLVADVKLTERTGRIYVFACGTDGKYSAAAEEQYAKPAPKAPNAPTVTSILGGMSIAAEPIPSDCLGMNVYIGNQCLYAVNNAMTYTCAAGIYHVSVAYVDLFGEGEHSAETVCTVKVKIDQALMDEEAVSLANVDKALQEAIQKGADAKDQVVSLVGDLSSQDGAKKYSALVQLQSNIEARIEDQDKHIISRINMSPETITIDGKWTHITGDTTIDKNVIVNGMIDANAVTSRELAAGSVTADKMSVATLSAITATIGTLQTATSGARSVLKDNLFEVYDSNNRLRVRLGVW
ncbi:MAG: phage tail protein [Megasphaera elsdenii]|uniref:TipJ family phage tail tip protein n=1 Tax=Megasphaera elsdenii TaxID=907 RepID=UPI003F03BEFB